MEVHATLPQRINVWKLQPSWNPGRLTKLIIVKVGWMLFVLCRSLFYRCSNCLIQFDFHRFTSYWWRSVRDHVFSFPPSFACATFLWAQIYVNRETSANEAGFGLVSIWEYFTKILSAFTLLAAVTGKSVGACTLVWSNTTSSIQALFLANGFLKIKNKNALLKSPSHYLAERILVCY